MVRAAFILAMVLFAINPVPAHGSAQTHIGDTLYNEDGRLKYVLEDLTPRKVFGDSDTTVDYYSVSLRKIGSNVSIGDGCRVPKGTNNLECDEHFNLPQLALMRKKAEQKKAAGKQIKERRAKEAALAEKNRIAKMRSAGWSEKVIEKVKEKKVFIGMTSMQAAESWGKPDDINRTINAAGTSEQWVYEGIGYLYFTDGILTTIQD